MEKPITPEQLKRLQVLYSQLARHTHEGADRAARMAWASNLLGRPIESFKAIRLEEAKQLIDTIQGQLGVKPSAQPRLSREQARKAGTEGRRGNASTEITLAGPNELRMIQRMLDVLGWSQVQLDALLRSSRSPIKGAHPVIRTLYQANRVYWALKGMATRKGKLRKGAA